MTVHTGLPISDAKGHPLGHVPDFKDSENTYVAAFERITELRQDAHTMDELLQTIVDTARTITGAKYAALGILTPDPYKPLSDGGIRVYDSPPDTSRVAPSVLKALQDHAASQAPQDRRVASACPVTGMGSARRVHTPGGEDGQGRETEILYECTHAKGESPFAGEGPHISRGDKGPLTQYITKFVHAGMPEEIAGLIGPHPEGRGLLGEIITTGRTVICNDMASHHGSYGVPKWHPKMTSFIGTPVRILDNIYGNLYVTESLNPQGFEVVDARALRVLANQAGAAIQFEYMDAQLKRAVLQDERSRIARDLHDGVMQSLFSIGMGLQGVSMQVAQTSPELAESIEGFVDLIDDTVRNIRATILKMRDSEGASNKQGLDQALVTLAREVEATVGLRPSLDLSTNVNHVIPDAYIADVVFFVREALSNANKHASATRMRVSTSLNETTDPHTITIAVRDNGNGFDVSQSNAGHGLCNMRERATLLHAAFTIDSAPGKGTSITLSIPLPTQDT